MDKVKKALARLSKKEKVQVENILVKLQSGDFQALDIKKLKGREDIFRVRKGDVRIIYKTESKKIFILTVERRSEKTYNL
ncbi:MAG: type II toxin-antitoxin system RelE/ParE family toxin [Patescibacteria group bacterium]